MFIKNFFSSKLIWSTILLAIIGDIMLRTILSRGCLIVISIILFIVAAFTVFNSVFLFNPITFKKDYITPQDLYQYRTPLQINYYCWSENAGWISGNSVESDNEFNYIIYELKEAKEPEYSSADYLLSNETRGEEFTVIIRRKIGKNEYMNLVQLT